jgi:hypothetical protein
LNTKLQEITKGIVKVIDRKDAWLINSKGKTLLTRGIKLRYKSIIS